MSVGLVKTPKGYTSASGRYVIRQVLRNGRVGMIRYDWIVYDTATDFESRYQSFREVKYWMVNNGIDQEGIPRQWFYINNCDWKMSPALDKEHAQDMAKLVREQHIHVDACDSVMILKRRERNLVVVEKWIKDAEAMRWRFRNAEPNEIFEGVPFKQTWKPCQHQSAYEF